MWLGPERTRRVVSSLLAGRGKLTPSAVSAAISKVVKSDSEGFVHLGPDDLPVFEVEVECKDGAVFVSATSSKGKPVPFCYRTSEQPTATCAPPVLRYFSGVEGACPAWIMPDAHGLGMYEVRPTAAMLKSLAAASTELTQPERRRLRAWIGDGLERGDLSLAELAVILRQAGDDYLLRTAGMSQVRFAVAHAAEGKERDELRAFALRVYGPAVPLVGGDGNWFRSEDEPGQREIRDELLQMLVIELRARPWFTAAAKRGRKLITAGKQTAANPPEARDVAAAFFQREPNDKQLAWAMRGLNWTAPMLVGAGSDELLEALAKKTDWGINLGSYLKKQRELPEAREASWAWVRRNRATLSPRARFVLIDAQPCSADNRALASELARAAVSEFPEPRRPRMLSAVAEMESKADACIARAERWRAHLKRGVPSR